MNAALDRRGFVTVCAGLCAGAILEGCVSMVTHPVPVAAGRVRLTLAEYPRLAGAAGAIKIQPDTIADPVYVLTSGDSFGALSPICSHRGCTVDVRGPRLVCPCHGSTYDRDGRVLRGPAERPLTRYPVERDGDAIVISVPGVRSPGRS